MNMELLMQYVTYALMAIGILAFVVAVIVQVIKETPWFKDIPTNAVALVASLIICLLAVAVICQLLKIAVIWYYWIAAVIASFIVYLVATGGWERIMGIWERTRYNNGKK